MATTSTKKTTKTKKAATKATVVTNSPATLNRANVLKGPRITEKASWHQMVGVYTFDITENATKRDIIREVQILYKVTPRMVRVARVPEKTKRNARTGRTGVSKSGRKAYVYLKAGETISIA